jgi:hypothetical protein
LNIFFLSHDVEECAKWHVDKHMKMILEYAQLLSTAHWELDNEPHIRHLYKPTHKNHPSAVWTRQSNNNYTWLHCLLRAVCKEYTYRYGKVHATESKGIVAALATLPHSIPVGPFTQPTQAMPETYKQADSIQAYRDYYRIEKAPLHSWKNRPTPEWI